MHLPTKLLRKKKFLELTSTQRHILHALYTRANVDTGTTKIYATNKSLVLDTGYVINTIKENIKTIYEKGLIKSIGHTEDNRNIYRLYTDDEMETFEDAKNPERKKKSDKPRGFLKNRVSSDDVEFESSNEIGGISSNEQGDASSNDAHTDRQIETDTTDNEVQITIEKSTEEKNKTLQNDNRYISNKVTASFKLDELDTYIINLKSGLSEAVESLKPEDYIRCLSHYIEMLLSDENTLKDLAAETGYLYFTKEEKDVLIKENRSNELYHGNWFLDGGIKEFKESSRFKQQFYYLKRYKNDRDIYVILKNFLLERKEEPTYF